jgi:hypothetical protein
VLLYTCGKNSRYALKSTLVELQTGLHVTDRSTRYRPAYTLQTGLHVTDRSTRYRPAYTLQTGLHVTDRPTRYRPVYTLQTGLHVFTNINNFTSAGTRIRPTRSIITTNCITGCQSKGPVSNHSHPQTQTEVKFSGVASRNCPMINEIRNQIWISENCNLNQTSATACSTSGLH